MLDDFFVRAILAGVGLALTTGPLGCFVIWRRMAYFGDTMAHSALLGIALSLLLDVDIMVSVFVVAAAVSLLLLCAAEARRRCRPMRCSASCRMRRWRLGLVLVAFMTWVRVDLMGFLFGDILAVSKTDIDVDLGRRPLVLACLAYLWRPLLAATVSRGDRRGRGHAAGAGEAAVHAADGAGHRDRDEDRRHPADHLAADHSGGDRAALFVATPEMHGGDRRADRRARGDWRALRLAGLRHAVRPVDRRGGACVFVLSLLPFGREVAPCPKEKHDEHDAPTLTEEPGLVLGASTRAAAPPAPIPFSTACVTTVFARRCRSTGRSTS